MSTIDGSPPSLEVRSGYTRLTISASRTQLLIADIHDDHRQALAAAALIIRDSLESEGPITRRLMGRPRVARGGAITIVLTDRLGRRRHRMTITPEKIAARLALTVSENRQAQEAKR